MAESKKKGKGGRPSKYTEDMPERLIAFFDRDPFTVEVVDGKEIHRPCRFPTLARFAVEQGISRETLHSWAHDTDDDGNLLKPEFSDAYKIAKAYQEAILVEGGMAGAFHASFAIFTAKNVLGWRDSQHHALSDGEGGDLFGSLIEALGKTRK